MKKISQYQIVVMFLDELPGNYKFSGLKHEIDNTISCFKNTKKVYEVNSDNDAAVPSEIARLVYENEDASLHISASNISLTLRNPNNSKNIVELIGANIEELEVVTDFISNIYRLRYRVGIVIVTELDDETLQNTLKSDMNLNVKEYPEIELSLLKKRVIDGKSVNIWNRRFYNSNEKKYLQITDVNTSNENISIQLGENKLADIYNDLFKGIIEEEYE